MAIWLLSSCSAKRNLVYLSDIADTAAYSAAITNMSEPRIQHGDILSITINNVDPETSNLFNKGILPVAASNPLQGNTGLTAQNIEGYLVDKTGSINFPSVGKIKLEGLTPEEAVGKITTAVGTLVKNPIVNVRFLNFKVTVIGEVNKPGVFNVTNNKLNILEALGLAGDMTMYGRREDVWVMHEEKGNRKITHINLNSGNALQSPAFYLQQNDVVYVKPDKMKEKQARTDTKTLSIIVAAATVITVIISRLF
ncbi:polysaccharide biosynthesis/export family protein [Mucilaginibacter defluvii]|uniref:Polysaccharide biosynthesis/export family protein n=1 Tax=Mucilaginibacter defluvii TaxID=1196019 RepID=A0ABP9FYX8_9SPHI